MDKLAAMATFVKVVEAGSFTRAAAALGIPKARVSQRLTDLESYLQVRLINRTTRSLQLTLDGQTYFDQCQTLLQRIDEIETTLNGGAIAPSGLLRVDCLASVARWILAPQLPDFQEKFPNLQLSLGSSDRVSHLLEDGFDCAIRGGALKDSGMVARHLCNIELGLYAAPAYLDAVAPIDCPDDLDGLQRLSWFPGNERAPFSWVLLSKKAEHLSEAQHGMQFDDPDVAIRACMAGGGICPGAPFAVREFVMAGNLVPVLPQWHFPFRPIQIVYPGTRHLSARTRSFVDWVQELFMKDARIRLTPKMLAESTSAHADRI